MSPEPPMANTQKPVVQLSTVTTANGGYTATMIPGTIASARACGNGIVNNNNFNRKTSTQKAVDKMHRQQMQKQQQYKQQQQQQQQQQQNLFANNNINVNNENLKATRTIKDTIANYNKAFLSQAHTTTKQQNAITATETAAAANKQRQTSGNNNNTVYAAQQQCNAGSAGISGAGNIAHTVAKDSCSNQNKNQPTTTTNAFIMNMNIKKECSSNIAIKSEPNEPETQTQSQQQQQQQQKQQQQRPTPPTTILQPTSSSIVAAATNKNNKNNATTSSNDNNAAAATTSSQQQTAVASAPYNVITTTRPRPVLLNAVNPHIICNLCLGYLIDATTIVECLHSFCHSCLIKHLRTEQYCPRCEMMINTAKPNIKSDTTLQAIVYKLVPGLYERELMRRRAFYKDRPEEAALASPEQRGDDTEHLIFSPSDYMSLSLEYADINELNDTSGDYGELLRPRYLQCPAMYTVGHLKKFVFGKFEIDTQCFSIDIMYKVKTIVLLDYYTLMDVAYIYTWKRDAPMRFYFRVKESLCKPIATTAARKVRRCLPAAAAAAAPAAVDDEKQHKPVAIEVPKKAEQPEQQQQKQNAVTPAPAIKKEPEPDEFEVIAKPTPQVEPLKLIIVNKNVKDKQLNSEAKSPQTPKAHREKKSHCFDTPTSRTPNSAASTPSSGTPGVFKDERRVENIKLKIDLSKQNSVTIINMSDPERKEIVKPIKPERESKTKNRKDKDGSPKSSPSSERRSKNPSPLTVPPLTIKTERFTTPSPKTSPRVSSPNLNGATATRVSTPPPALLMEEQEKSEFLKSFALTPIKAKSLSPEKPKTLPNSYVANNQLSLAITKTQCEDKLLMKPPTAMPPKSVATSKRKSKEPIKAIAKKPKVSPPLPTEDFKIKLPLAVAPVTTPNAATAKNTDKPLMPPPSKPPASTTSRKSSHKFAAPPPLPLHQQGVHMAAPGNRTPIAKRYQPILPKAARPNPFASLSSDTAVADLSAMESEGPPSKRIAAPKVEKNMPMGPPPVASSKTNNVRLANGNATAANGLHSTGKQNGGNKSSNSYLNLALFNSSKSKGKEVPPGCRTPMYTPNSPSYSPSSPQYVPNYNIPTVPTYKYTPKPSNANSYLQNILGTNNPMASLFPAPPTKKECNNQNTNPSRKSGNAANDAAALKRAYPYSRSPSPNEDGAEKQQVKVKSLLNSCNINIPASLSITLTREDSESSSSNATHPKHKSPVNNYIEIVKLPDQTVADKIGESNKRLSPPAPKPNNPQVQPPLSHQQNKHTSLKTIPSPQHLMSRLPPTLPPPALLNGLKPMNTSPTGNDMKVTASPKTSPTISKQSAAHKPILTPMQQSDKKTPSPEKRNGTQMANISPTSGENKSPKSTANTDNGNGGAQAAKKFRHILPRQQPQAKSSSNGNGALVVGAAAAAVAAAAGSNGLPMKIGNTSCKKVPQPTKKSPNSIASNAQQQKSPVNSSNNNNNNHSPKSKSATPMAAPPKKSPTTAAAAAVNLKNAKNSTPPPTAPPTVQPPAAATALNKLLPLANAGMAALPVPHPLVHPMSAALPNLGGAPLSMASSAANQAELSKFLKDNLLRAQVAQAAQAAQAAQVQANQTNLFYNYANAAAAAQMGHMTPEMYNYQQVFIMQQLSRMQRAGTDAFNEYMQKLKTTSNSLEAAAAAVTNNTTGKQLAISDSVEPKPSATGAAKSLVSSPKTSPSNAAAAAPPAATPTAKGNAAANNAQSLKSKST